MSELESSVSLRKPGWRTAKTRQTVGWLTLQDLRRVVRLILLTAVVALCVEAISAYVLYRHFSNLNHSFYPIGSATVALVENIVAKAEGRHADATIVSIDHGPLFHADKLLGYSMYPGKYRIKEKHYGQSHEFDLTVNDLGRRVTSATANTASRHLYIAGDSAMFGWGLNDDQTLPWLLQTRFPKFDVVNLSLTSYSTIQALRQVESLPSKVNSNDVLVLTYHPLTNGFNVASEEMLGFLRTGFEHQLGDADVAHNMSIPFGSIGENGLLAIENYPVIACARPDPEAARCPSRQLSADESNRVTERAFDAILDAQHGHVVVALLSGSASDPVVQHLKSKGVFIADLRMDKDDPDATDVVFIDAHPGPFWHRAVAERLGDILERSRLAE